MAWHEIQKPPTDWAALVDEWLDVLRAAGYSHATVKTRRCQLTHVALGVGCGPLELDGRRLAAYFGGQDWSRNTRKGYMDTMKRFYAWLVQTGQVDKSPVDVLPRVREAQPHPRPCPDKEILMALRKADDRAVLMLRLAAECGLRRAEIAAVKSDDVSHDLLGWSLTVVGKGDKQRVVPLGDSLAEEIKRHEGYLFPGGSHGHLCPNTVGKIISSLLPDGWTPHTLRHRYATRTYEATHDIYIVSKLLGHTSIATTERYVAMPDSRLRSAVSAVAIVA